MPSGGETSQNLHLSTHPPVSHRCVRSVAGAETRHLLFPCPSVLSAAATSPRPLSQGTCRRAHSPKGEATLVGGSPLKIPRLAAL